MVRLWLSFIRVRGAFPNCDLEYSEERSDRIEKKTNADRDLSGYADIPGSIGGLPDHPCGCLAMLILFLFISIFGSAFLSYPKLR